MPISNKTVGIDLGLTDLFITSSGEKSGNPKFTKRYERKLAYFQRELAKKQKGSNNRVKARLKVARQLQYKAEWADRTVIEIDRFFPNSKHCSSCGFVNESLPLSIREWD
ncbi:hypothetical protein ACH42_03700 [Endozoicomonas sp. (ex Bugula neritina AB1)]|nr:hypothetical protein ACH42_03700 [Endozoicomonas sp. (ex Bugula neritina AB1)]